MKNKTAVILITLVWCATCGAQTLTANQVYNPAIMPGPFLFQDGYGHHLSITPETALFCEVGVCDGKFIIWHYQKDDCNAYWNPGRCSGLVMDELFLILHHDLPQDGYTAEQWRVVGFKWVGSGQKMTRTVWPTSINSLAYVFIPPSADSLPQHRSGGQNTTYTSATQSGFTDAAVGPPDPASQTTWTTYSWLTVMPYKGVAILAMASEQCEGGSPGVCDAVHEILYLGAGVGPIAVWPIVGLQTTSDQLRVFSDPKLIMLRTN